jgi:hypothetical protein
VKLVGTDKDLVELDFGEVELALALLPKRGYRIEKRRTEGAGNRERILWIGDKCVGGRSEHSWFLDASVLKDLLDMTNAKALYETSQRETPKEVPVADQR